VSSIQVGGQCCPTLGYLNKAIFDFGASCFARQRPTAFGVLSTLFGITGHDDLHSSVTGNIDSKDLLGAQAP
jgi:hypothetical protein